MNEKLESMIEILNNKLKVLKSEVLLMMSDLKQILVKSEENQKNIVNSFVPDTSLKTITVLKFIFPDFSIPTKKTKLFFTVADISLTELRSKVRLLIDNQVNHYHMLPFEFKNWNMHYYNIRFLEGSINIKNQEIEEVTKSIEAAQRLLKINKNKLSSETIDKINDGLVFTDNDFMNFVMWRLLLDNPYVSKEILTIEEAGDFDPEYGHEVSFVSEQGDNNVVDSVSPPTLIDSVNDISGVVFLDINDVDPGGDSD
jgi:hypothetical protein